jgi:HSP20 family protein
MKLMRWEPRVKALNVWEPFEDLVAFNREVDRIFGNLLGPIPFTLTSTEEPWSPRVDVSETDAMVVLKAELPGVKQEDIQVSIQDNTLTLKGERKLETDVKQGRYTRIERSYGAFQRSMALPPAVDANQVKATYKDGILEIQLPKKEDAKPKEIKVETV